MGLENALRQTFAVYKFEVRRQMLSWRIPASIAFISILFFVTEISVNAETSSLFEERMYVGHLVSAAIMAVAVSAVIFSSDILVSEFENGTGFIVFTKPIGRFPLFSGKYLAAFTSLLLTVALCYLAIACFTRMHIGSVPETFAVSLAFMVLYAFAALGICMLFSSVSPRTVASPILALFSLTIVGNLISGSDLGGTEPWFSLYYSATAVSNVMTEKITMFDYVADPLISAMVMATYGVFSAFFSAIAFRVRSPM